MTDAQLSLIEAHLVVKRGHHGRFRFILISGGERIGGEVHIGDADQVNDVDLRSVALKRIARLAGALLESLGSTSNAEPNRTSADIGAKSPDVLCELEIGAGG